MPAGDGTGPAGRGPMTGRGLGYCAGYQVPGYMNNAAPRRGFGRGRGFGFGRGYGRGFYGAPYNPGYAPGYYNAPNPAASNYNQEDEVEYLKNTAKALEDELKAVRDRLDQLEE
ncbi:MAG: DUF5320 domain-containing protein [Bacillota bacterium]